MRKCDPNHSGYFLGTVAKAAAIVALGAVSAPALAEPLVITDRATRFEIPAGDLATATASCLPGELVVSGGYEVVPTAYREYERNRGELNVGAQDWHLVPTSYPSNNSEWSVVIANRTSRARKAVVHAHCAAGGSAADPEVKIARSPFGEIEPDLAGVSLRALCPEGYSVTGGGWAIPYVSSPAEYVRIRQSAPTQGNEWAIDMDISSFIADEDLQAQAYAVCAKGLGIVRQGDPVEIKVPGAAADAVSTRQASVTCGTRLAGAGFRTDSEVLITSAFAHNDRFDVVGHAFPKQTIHGARASDAAVIELTPTCILPVEPETDLDDARDGILIDPTFDFPIRP